MLTVYSYPHTDVHGIGLHIFMMLGVTLNKIYYYSVKMNYACVAFNSACNIIVLFSSIIVLSWISICEVLFSFLRQWLLRV